MDDVLEREYEAECIKRYQNKVFGRPDEVEDYYRGLLVEMNTGELPHWKKQYKHFRWIVGSGRAEPVGKL